MKESIIKKIKEKQKNNKIASRWAGHMWSAQHGVTILALVVMIIVLIILSGVSVSLLMSDNGIIKAAKEKKEAQEIRDVTEKLELYKVDVSVDHYNKVEMEEYIEYVNKIQEKGTPTYNIKETDRVDDEQSYILVENKYEYLVKEEENGNLKIIYQGKADELPPRIQNVIADSTTNSITVDVTSTRVKEYLYYIKENGEYQLKGNTESKDGKGKYTFENLTQGQTYSIKIVAKNKNGTDERELDIAVGKMAELTETEVKYIHSTNWTNQDVITTIKIDTDKDISKYYIQYAKFEEGEEVTAEQLNNAKWSTYTASGIVSEKNERIYTRLFDGYNATSYTSTQILNIDKLKPTISKELNSSDETTKEFSLNIEVIDAHSGLGKIEWYYKLSTANNYASIVDTYTELNGQVAGTTTATVKNKKLTDLQTGTYKAYAIVYDVAGNSTQTPTIEIEVKPVEKATGATINPTEYTKGNVVVTLPTKSEYTTQYQIGELNEAGAWSTYNSENKITIENNTTVYYRYHDGKNAGEYSYITVGNIDKEAPTATSIEIKNVTPTGYDVYVYGVKDNLSGVNRLQFPTWTEANGQDDIQTNWESNAQAKGTDKGNGTWYYRVNVTDHNSETGKYNTHVYAYDNLGNKVCLYTKTVDVSGVNITFDNNDGSSEKTIITKGYNLELGTLPTLTKAGYTFDGWFTDKTGGTQILSTTKVPAVDTTYYAHWTLNTYTITYNLDGGSVATANPTTYNVTTADITLNNPTKTGYTFTGWTGSNGTTAQTTVTIAKGSTGDKSYTANWTPNTYNITYNLNGGSVATANPTTYNVTTADITLNNPTKTGYTFTGWTGSNGSTPQTTVTIAKGSTGDKSYTANWTPMPNTPYKVIHQQMGLDGTTYTTVETENKTGTTDTKVTPAVKTYTGFTSPATQEVTIAADGSTTVTYKYARNKYTYTLGSGIGVSTSGSTASGSYYYEATITLKAAANAGYTWSKWTSSNTGLVANQTTASTTFKMPAGALTMTPSATINTYKITYNLNGGSVATANPTTYNVTTADITLNNPTKTGYTFTGWTGSNGTTAQTTVTIAKGSTGDKSYTANWTPMPNTPYKVIHQQMGLDGTTYTTVETENKTGTTDTKVTPAVKTYTGFTSPAAQEVTIAADGSTTVTYKYTRNKYTYTLGSGTGVVTTGSSATGSYYYGATITLKAAANAGYTWSKWTSSNTSLVASTTTANTTFTMPAGAITMTPSATVNTYNITYNLNGGSVATANPTTYKVTTADITLNNPTKTGYTFTGWTGSNGSTPQTTVTIAKGSTGDKSYTANWKANTYTISYNGNGATGGSTASSTHTYDTAKALTANGFTRAYTVTYNHNYTGSTNTTKTATYSFKNWNTKADGSGTAYANSASVTNLATSGTFNLYAQWNAASVTYVPTRTGYTFGGWYAEAACTTSKAGTDGKYTPTADITLYAKWIPNQYAITYNSNMKYEKNQSQSGFTITPMTETAGNFYRASFTKTSGTGSEWRNIKFPYYQYEVGATYVVRMKIRMQSVSNCSAAMRHSIISNDYGTPGRQQVDFTSGAIGEWKEYTLTRTITSNTTTQSSTTYNVNPLIEIYTSDLALTGTITSRSMTFDFKDIYVEKVSTEQKTYGTTLGTLSSPTRTGYTLKGWFTARTGGTQISSTTNVPSANTTYYAQWTPNTNTAYKVVHQQMGLDGTTYTTVETENKTGTTDTKVTPAVKTYTGFTSPAAQEVTIAADGSTTVTYKYTRNKYTYTLGSGTGVVTTGSSATGSYYYGATITLKAAANAGYTFSKWTSSNTGLVGNQTTASTTFTMPAGALTMTPSATVNTYTITYNLNGGSVATANPTSYKVTTADITLNNPTKTGYTFAGWTGSNGTTAQTTVAIAKGSTGDKSYTANWTANTYTISYNGNGATSGSTESSTHTYDTAKALTSNGYVRTGYTFAGWATSSTGAVVYTNGKSVNNLTSTNGATITLYAVWTAKSHTLTVNPNGGTYESSTNTKTYTQNYGTTVTVATPTKTGYTFGGWVATKQANNATWVEVLYHNPMVEGFTNEAGAKSKNTLNAYSILGQLDNLKYNNQYEFLLQVDEKAGYNQWIQTSNPATTTTVTGYKAVANSWNASNFAGLVKCSGNTLIAWTTSTSNWWYAIGMYGVRTCPIVNEGSLWTAMPIHFYTKAASDLSNINTAITGTLTTDNKMYIRDEDVTLTANWIPNTNTAYKVVHQQMGLDGITYTTVETENKTGTTDTKVTPAVKTYTGFTSPAAQEVTIAADGSTTVTYKYTRNKYTYTLGSGTGVSTSGSSATGSYYYGATITLKAAANAGYTWSKWTSSNTGLIASTTTASTTFTMPAGNLSMTPSATVNTYNITYNLNGGSVAIANPTTYNVTTADITLNNPTKTGYTFTGWTGSNGSTPQTTVIIAKGSTGDKSYTANWTPNTYTVVYNGNGATGGSTASSTHTYDTAKALTANGFTRAYTVTYNHNYTGSTNTTKTATYSFKNWNTNAAGSGTAYANSVSVTNLATSGTFNLYAQWNAASVTYVPTRTGYTFGGWYAEAACTTSKAGTNGVYTPTANITLYAKWTPNTYTISYNGNGATGGSTASSTHTYDTAKALTANGFARAYTVTYNHNYTGSTNTTKTATYSFKNWNTNAAGSGTAYANSASVTNLATSGTFNLYAQWNAASVTYVPTRTGYTFGGWYAEAACTTSKAGTNGVYTPTANITLYAKWTPNTYTISYNGNGATGGSTASSTHTYDTAKALTANGFTRAYTVTYNHNYTGSTNTTKTATYSFKNWNTNAAGSGTAYANSASVTNLATSGTFNLYAQWNAASVTYVPTRTGYTFGGWYAEAACTTSKAGTNGVYTPTANITLYAKWTPNTYTISYNGNGATGGSTASSTHTYDTAKALTANGFTRAYTVTYNHNYTGSTNTTKTATYSFKNWNTNAAGSGTAYANSASVTNLATSGTFNLYAQWNAASVTYVPTRTGYTFGGWYAEAACTTSKAGTNGVYTPTANITLYAKWTPNTYTVTYNKGTATGGTLPANQTATYNASITLGTNNMTKSITNLGTVTFDYNGSGAANTNSIGYTKYETNGWTTTSGSQAKNYDSGDTFIYTLTSDLTLYPCFTQTKVSATFPSPTRTGYTFAGWYTAASGGTKVTSYTGTTAVTYYAHWTPNTYTVTYNGNGNTGGSTASSTHTYNTAKNLTANGFTKTGYTFKGWAKTASGSVVYTNSQSVTNLSSTNGGNVTLYAVWADTTAPKLVASFAAETGIQKIRTQVSFEDSGSGIAKVRFHMREKGKTEELPYHEITYNGVSLMNDFTDWFKELKCNTVYQWYAEAWDVAGNRFSILNWDDISNIYRAVAAVKTGKSDYPEFWGQPSLAVAMVNSPDADISSFEDTNHEPTVWLYDNVIKEDITIKNGQFEILKGEELATINGKITVEAGGYLKTHNLLLKNDTGTNDNVVFANNGRTFLNKTWIYGYRNNYIVSNNTGAKLELNGVYLRNDGVPEYDANGKETAKSRQGMGIWSNGTLLISPSPTSSMVTTSTHFGYGTSGNKIDEASNKIQTTLPSGSPDY